MNSVTRGSMCRNPSRFAHRSAIASCRNSGRRCRGDTRASSSPDRLRPWVLLLVAVFAAGCGGSYAGKRTVCTITVNSPDEKEMFRQRLPEDQYQFVELVERGRPDWLASACRQGIHCDRARHLRPFRREHRVLFRSDRLASEYSAGRRDGARLLQRLLSRTVLAIEGGLSFRVQYVECGRDQEHVLGSRAKPCPRRALEGRGRAPGAHSGSAPWRKQPRPHAPHFHERAGHLWLLFGRAAGAHRGDAPEPLLATVVDCRGRQRSCESQAPQSLCHRVHDRRQRIERLRIRKPAIGARFANSSTTDCRRRRNSASSTASCTATWRKSACSSSASKACLRR